MNGAIDPTPRQRRALLWLLVAAICWRAALALRTPVPAEDGVNYLWMAQQFARGNAAAALSEPFSPLWSLLLSLPIAFGVEPFAAGRVLGCLCGGFALLPIAAIAERLQRGAGPLAAALCATSSVFARTGVEVLTEPLFVLVAGFAVLAGVAGRWWWLGVAAGLAFWVRPEGILCAAPWLLLTPRRAWRALLPALGLVLLLGAWRWWCGHGFDPVPKLQFHALRDDLGTERAALLPNLLQLPAGLFEAFAAAALFAVLALLPWPARDRRAERPLWLLLLCGALAIAAFVVRRRFFVSWTPVVMPLAGAMLARLRLPERARELVLAAACGIDMWTAWHGTIAVDRLAERLVGEHLAARLPPGHSVVGDMTRVLWFAGQRPLPPRHFDADWFVQQARAPTVDFVVMHETGRRDTFAAVVAGLRTDFARYALPPQLEDLAASRGIAVFVRR